MNIFVTFNELLQRTFGKNFEEAVSSLLLITFLTTVYVVFFYYIKSHETSNEKKLRRFVSLRNTTIFVMVIGLIVIWSGEIKTMILSITAMSAAIIIAFKEIILCFSGSLLIASNKLFSIGDYIEIDGIKGKVIDKNFIYTRLSISDAMQLRELNVPNMTFITNKVINLSTSVSLQSYHLKLAVPSLQKLHHFGEEVKEIAEEIIGVKTEYFKSFFIRETTDLFREIPEKFYHIEYDLDDSRTVSIKLHYMSLPYQQQEIENKVLERYLVSLANEDDIVEKFAIKKKDDDLKVVSEN